MPDDASGNFSLVSGYLAVTGQTVQPSNHNPPLEDIAVAMTSRLSRSGIAPMTGSLKTITGSASAPAIYPNSNPSIGIYWTSNGIGFAGTISGARFIGELIPYTFLTALAFTVFPYGQTLLRASYLDLWEKAQTDIAAGNTFYNNGNGTTTFGIGDLRGRVVAGFDAMGGTAANRLDTTTMSTSALGGTGGAQTQTLTQANLPNTTFAFTGTAAEIISTSTDSNFISSTGFATTQSGTNAIYGTLSGSVAKPVTSNALYTPAGTVSSGGSGTPLVTVQPTMVCNYLLYAGA